VTRVRCLEPGCDVMVARPREVMYSQVPDRENDEYCFDHKRVLGPI